MAVHLGHSSEDLWNNREFILKAVKINGKALHYALVTNLWNDREIVLKAVKSYGHVLELASENLRNDRELFSKL